MCVGKLFRAPKVPATPALPAPPTEEDIAAKGRRSIAGIAASIQAGRAATITTSPLGDSGFGKNIQGARLGGF